MSTSFRILALDGGGMRGVFTAAALCEIEDAFDGSIQDQLDLITGTSTGGIIALGLAAGFPGSDLLSFYRDHGGEIFGKRQWPGLFRPRYDRAPLDKLLREKFGDRRMNDLTTDVCITAHELVYGTTRVIKNDHAVGLRWGGDRLVWKVAAATAAAPSYFAPVQLDAEDCHIDGGVWANNPALVGITEAVRYFGKQLDSVRLLSIGTTSKTLRVKNNRRAARMGRVQWGLKLTDLLQGTVSMASHRQAELLLPPGHYLRLDDELAEKISLDDVAAALPLQERGQQVAREHMQGVRTLLGSS